MIRGQILYAKESGSQVLFDEVRDDVIYAHVKSNGVEYPVQSLASILGKGYWQEVYTEYRVPETFEKHASHDQSSHGSWAGGGGYVAGRDLINEDYNNPILLSKEDTSFSLTSAGRTDSALNEIIKKQGFDGKAKLVDKEEFRQVLDSGGYARYRGVTEYTDSDGNLVSGDNITVAFAEGEYRSGLGVSGNGIYTTHSIDTAEAYASKRGNVDDYGNIVRMAILPNAKIATEEQTSLFINEMRNPANSPYLELGRIMAAKGFDGYVSSGNGVPSTIMLNRTAMVVLKP